uniref:Uncharacterized protein n=1 Tax=Phaseolus vulgaris TaxID=3885 RepID=V7CPU4_PHAVU|nr:hypothetical protein PHAVU_002G302800g [Phaseolus vulgaris]ESW32212.1 hypothetical protein PHAVU_002G302800g [Phaseolus vulgaris]
MNSGRPSIDDMDSGMNPRLSTGSDFDNRSYGSSCSGAKSSAGAEAKTGEFRSKEKVKRKGERSCDLIGGRGKEVAGNSDQAIEQAKHKP